MKEKINYSLDMIRLDFEMEKDSVQRFYDRCSLDTTVSSWESFKFNSYKYNFTFACNDNNSFWVGSEPNYKSCTDGMVLITLEFNPNKVGDDLTLINVYGSFMVSCRSVTCSRFDLAVDIPVKRSECVMMKDKRKYVEFRNSDSDLTQYLGVRHKHGYTKLYNKALESKMSEDKLTRLEITVKYSERGDMDSVIPRVFMIGGLDDTGINGTDKALLYGALLDVNILNFLDKRKKKKIKDILADTSLTFEFDEKKYLAVLSLVDKYINKSMFIKGL